MKIADVLTGAGSFGAPLLAAAVLTLTGCSAEVTNPGGQVDTDTIKTGNVVQVTADASQMAMALDGARTDKGYPTTAPQVTLTGANTLTAYRASETGYVFCVVEPSTGAWAYYDSTQGGVVGSGDSGQTCAAG